METSVLYEISEKLEKIENLLLCLNSYHKEIMNVEEAAEYCGLKASYIYKLCSQREIPHYKNSGKMLRFRKDELTAWLLRNRVKSSYEIEQESYSYIISSRM